MRNVLIIGSSGMIGRLILDACLENKEINKVTSIVRNISGIIHPKLVEIVHRDFLDYSGVKEMLGDHDVCFYCIGVYTGQVSKEEFRKITVDYTKAFAEAVKQRNDKLTFCFLSGQGADVTERSPIMFARDKGAAENILLNLKFYKTYIFRPGYIYPTNPRKEPNFLYRVMRLLYKPLFRWIYPNIGISSMDLAYVMFDIGLHGGEKIIYENKDIRDHRKL